MRKISKFIAYYQKSKAGRTFTGSSLCFSESHRVKMAHFVAHCGIQSHLQLWPLFAQHKGDISGLGEASAAFHCNIESTFYSYVSVKAQKAPSTVDGSEQILPWTFEDPKCFPERYKNYCVLLEIDFKIHFPLEFRNCCYFYCKGKLLNSMSQKRTGDIWLFKNLLMTHDVFNIITVLLHTLKRALHTTHKRRLKVLYW